MSSATPATDAVEKRVVALAEQLGRLVGTVQARADGWVDLPALNDQLMRVRDGAAGILRQLKGGRSQRKKPGRKPTAKATGRSGGKVDAPGKTHRKAPPRTPAVKKSDQMIPKAKAARQTRRRAPGA